MAGELTPRPSDVFVGMEATRHWMAHMFARLAAEGYSVCVINPMEVGRPQAQRASRGSKRSGRRAAHRRDLAHRRVRGDQLASDEVQSLRHAHPLPPGDQEEAAQVKIRLTCVMDSYFPSTPAFSPTCSARRRLPSWRSHAHARAAQAQAPSLASEHLEAARRQIGQAKASAQGRREIQRRHNPRARRGVVRYLGDGLPEYFLEERASEVEAHRGAAHGHRAARAPASPACRWRQGVIVAEVGDVSRFRSAAALVSYAPELVGEPVRAVRLQGRPITKQGDPYLRRAVAGGEPRPPARPGAQGLYDKKRPRANATESPSRRS